ncbi:hypothetical protein [Neolewinella persica]|uniref:hypothetical protein n=1 Tax=Neolewinella persica TaxID=70998 RepID=UPI0003795AC5|nr:hypothetical protein [Neolewinella persica]
MSKVYQIFVSLALLLTACGNDATSTNAAIATEDTPEGVLSPDVKIAPPPPVCVYLTEATVLSYFDKTVKMPMPGRRSAAEYASCQYDLEAPGWSAALVVELPDPGSKQQAIIDEVAGAKGNDKVSLSEATGRFINQGRILSVAGKKHFRIKFSALPKQGSDEPFDEAARRELLLKMAGSVLGV